jgi:hypothetical protein
MCCVEGKAFQPWHLLNHNDLAHFARDHMRHRFENIEEQDIYSGFVIIGAKECVSEVAMPWCRDVGESWPIG